MRIPPQFPQFSGAFLRKNRDTASFEYGGETVELTGRDARRYNELAAAADAYQSDPDPPFFIGHPVDALEAFKSRKAQHAGVRLPDTLILGTDDYSGSSYVDDDPPIIG